MRLYDDSLEDTKTTEENLTEMARTHRHTQIHTRLIYIQVYVTYVPSGPRTETLCLRAGQSLVNCPTK